MRIIVNGQERQVTEGVSILTLLQDLRLSPDRVAVEVNRRLVRTAEYSAPVREGDVVEIVTFVGGG